MNPEIPAPISKAALWSGRVMSWLPALMMLVSAATKFAQPPPVAEGFAHLGWPMGVVGVLGAVQLACTILYLVPRTAVLGAILLTGYLGGAMAACVRVGDGFILQFIAGVFLWGGLWLRDARLRSLLPLAR